MGLALLHRRLTVAMGLAALGAFAGGAGFAPLSTSVAFIALLVALFWHPSAALSSRLEQLWLPLALVLVLRSLAHIFVIGDDVVVPVVDLLFLLMCAEALRSLDAPNDARLYALTFALLLAATAYRPGLLFAISFVVYVMLATVALLVGQVRRETEAHGTRDVRLGGRFLLRVSALSVVSLVMSAGVFLTFPRVDQSWAGRGDVATSSVVGFSDRVSIGNFGSTILPNPQVVLRVEFPDGRPPDAERKYWRGRSYDNFDGVAWSRSARLPSALPGTDWYPRWGPDRLRQRIYAAPLDARVLFTSHPVLSMEMDGDRVHPIFDNAGDYSYLGTGTLSYNAVSVDGLPSPDVLRASNSGYTPARAFYTQVPRLSQRTRDLALLLTAGADSNYEKALAIERFFHEEFQYTLELPRSAREAELEYFLFDRRAGHCEYFSTGMVILLRSLGINAREVNGFLGGEWNEFGNYLAVTQNEAHSWVEVWFPGQGWVPFDPTPAARGTTAQAQPWYWPGKFWLDGLQHRWNKWILDYGIASQSDLLQRAADFLNGSMGAAGDSPASGPPRQVVIVSLLLALLAGLVWANAGHTRSTPEARMYLRLKTSAASAGIPAGPAVTPMGLIRHLRTRDHPSARAAEQVVSYYLRARFGAHGLQLEERQDMAVALRSARGALSARPTR